MGTQRTYLTNPPDFRNVSRGNPQPYTLKRTNSPRRLTPETWRLEIVSEGQTQLQRQLTLDKKTALDLAALEKLGKQHGRKF